MRVILATASPTRKALCEKLGLRFEFISPDGAAEKMDSSTQAEKLVEENAVAKARAVAVKAVDAIIIGLDTVVHFDGKTIGKPKNDEDAKKILSEFGGKWHEIVTGISVLDAKSGRIVSGVEKTRVKFKQLSEQQIYEYVSTGEPMGKAGAYAIQEKGAALIDEIRGSETNVAGLPLEKITELLKQLGVTELPR